MIERINRRLLEKSVRRYGIAEEVSAARAIQEFEKTLAEVLNKKTDHRVKPLYLKNQVIYLSVISSVLAAEIRLYQKKILNKVNKKLGKEMIIGLRFYS